MRLYVWGCVRAGLCAGRFDLSFLVFRFFKKLEDRLVLLRHFREQGDKACLCVHDPAVTCWLYLPQSGQLEDTNHA